MAPGNRDPAFGCGLGALLAPHGPRCLPEGWSRARSPLRGAGTGMGDPEAGSIPPTARLSPLASFPVSAR